MVVKCFDPTGLVEDTRLYDEYDRPATAEDAAEGNLICGLDKRAFELYIADKVKKLEDASGEGSVRKRDRDESSGVVTRASRRRTSI